MSQDAIARLPSKRIMLTNRLVTYLVCFYEELFFLLRKKYFIEYSEQGLEILNVQREDEEKLHESLLKYFDYQKSLQA